MNEKPYRHSSAMRKWSFPLIVLIAWLSWIFYPVLNESVRFYIYGTEWVETDLSFIPVEGPDGLPVIRIDRNVTHDSAGQRTSTIEELVIVGDESVFIRVCTGTVENTAVMTGRPLSHSSLTEYLGRDCRGALSGKPYRVCSFWVFDDMGLMHADGPDCSPVIDPQVFEIRSRPFRNQ